MARLPTARHGLPAFNAGTAPPPPKVADRHYQTAEHRAWAAEVIRRAGGLCQSCGEPRRLIADHVQELRDGGAALDLDNGRALCWPCHTTKTAAVRAARHARRATPDGQG